MNLGYFFISVKRFDSHKKVNLNFVSLCSYLSGSMLVYKWFDYYGLTPLYDVVIIYIGIFMYAFRNIN